MVCAFAELGEVATRPHQNISLPYSAVGLVMTTQYSLPPFPPFPSASRYVALGSIEEAIVRVQSSINAREGISLIIGPPGTGKSLACNVLAEHFQESHDVVVLGELPIEDPSAYYRRLLHHLGVEYASLPEGDLHLRLVEQVRQTDSSKQGLLILVDEAQSLPADVLEAVRMTTNITRDNQPCVSAVICGGVKLEETLATASMEPFTQRVATRCYLHPMNADETRFYVAETIARCGSNPDDTITDEAIGAIHHACNGIPRLINQMMTEAIECAADADQTMICDNVVDQAWAQLQQLPSPVVNEQKIEHGSSPVEFGALDDTMEESIEFAASGEESRDSSAAEFGELETYEPAVSEVVATVSDVVDSEIEERLLEAVAANELAETQIAAEEELVVEVAGEDEMDDVEPAAVEFESTLSMEESLEAELELAIDEEARMQPEEEPNVIEFESKSATIVWSDEPAEPAQEKVASIAQVPTGSPLPEKIFGVFDQEEELNVGFAPSTGGNHRQAAQNHQPAAPVQSRIQAQPQAEIEIEELVHNDVINLNEMAAQARFGGVDPTNTFGDPTLPQQAAHDELVHAPIWIEEASVIQPQPSVAQPSVAQPSVVQPSVVQPQVFQAESDIDLIHDDSDLLIIEDELDVVPRPRRPRATESHTVKVDFQAMLSQMRSGS